MLSVCASMIAATLMLGITLPVEAVIITSRTNSLNTTFKPTVELLNPTTPAPSDNFLADSVSFLVSEIDTIEEEIRLAEQRAYEARLASRNLTHDVYTTSNLLASDFDKILSGTKLSGCGVYFEALEQTHKINGVFAIAVAEVESGIGNRNANTNNYWGRRASGGGWMSWATPEDSIMSLGPYMNGSRYKGKSISKISEIYCPPTASSWATKINSSMTRLYKKAGI